MANSDQVQQQEAMARQNYLTFEQMNIIINFQRLWVQLATWMRALLMSIIGTLPNRMAVTNRAFVGIPTRFSEALTVFYGSQISQQFRDLLANFIQNQWMLIEAMKDKDVQRTNQTTVQWYAAADALASFLARINVYWDQGQWRNYLYQYIRMSIVQITSAVAGDFEREIELYDTLENMTVLMGSYMARGIIARNLAIGIQPAPVAQPAP